MKKHIAEDGTRTHEFTAAGRTKLRSAILVLEEAAFFHRGDDDGMHLAGLIGDLTVLAEVKAAKPDAKKG